MTEGVSMDKVAWAIGGIHARMVPTETMESIAGPAAWKMMTKSCALAIVEAIEWMVCSVEDMAADKYLGQILRRELEARAQ